MAFSIAPSTSIDQTTIVGTYAEWDSLVRKMTADRSYRDIGNVVKAQLDKDKTIQRITLPKPQAQMVLKYCGISW